MSPLGVRWRKALRDFSSHWFRTLLVVSSIAIGIIAIGVMLGGRAILLREFDADFAASVPANITYHTQDFDAELVSRAEDIRGVQAVQARRVATMRYTREGVEEDRTMFVHAFDDFDDIRVARVVPLEGEWPPGPGEVVLEAAAKMVDDYAIGDVLTLDLADGETADLRVAGFAHDINAMPAHLFSNETGYVTFETMADLGEPESYNQLSLSLADRDVAWAEASRLAIDVRGDLFESENLLVFYTDVPEPGSHFLADIFGALSLLLLAIGVLSLGLSGFLVVNTVSSLMAQQVRQVGIMKAIGGTARQLEGLYIVIVAMYGAISVALGLPLAAAGTRWFSDYAADMLNFSISSYAPPLWVTAVEVSVGLLVPLLAASGPVRKGVRMSVVKALNATGMTETRFGHRLTDRILGSIRGLPRPVALSLRNTFLRKGRLILTLSTLTLASAMVMAVFGVQTSIKRTVDDLETYWGYNVQMSTAMPQEADGLEGAVSGVHGVESVETWMDYRATVVRADGTENEGFTVVGLDPETDFVVPTVVEGRWLEDGDTDALVVNTDTLNEEPSLEVGSEITLSVLGEEQRWRVVGVVKGQLAGAELFSNKSRLGDVLGTSDVSRVLVRGVSSSADDEQELLEAVGEALADSGYQITSARTRSGMAEQLGDLLGILVAFLLMAAGLLALVGLIGLTGTMTMNVLESTREIGVMRATGARHEAIYQIFMTEAITVGTMAWAAGAVLSYPLSLGLVWALGESIGVPLSFVFSWAGIGIWLALMLIISAFASVAPAFRASQVSVRDAIAYE